MSQGQKFKFDNREPSRIAKRMDSNTRKKNFLMERMQLERKLADLRLQRQDLVDRRDAFIVQSKSAKGFLKDLKKSDDDYQSMRNAEAVALRKASDLGPGIQELDLKIISVQAEIAANLDGLKGAIDAEIGRAGRAEIKGMLERGCNDAMTLVGELRAKLEVYERYQTGITGDAAAELARLAEGAEEIWRACRKL